VPDESIHPTYADRFRCIGPACEDTCCQGWSVPIDQAAWERYQGLPLGPLPDLIRASLVRPEPDAKPVGAAKPAFAIIHMNSENECPMLSEQRLCRIQSEFGESLLSHACAAYPRIVHSLGSFEEKALSLSCPEAARLVLLTPHLLADAANPAPRIESNPLPKDFRPIRSVVFKLVRDRRYPLWQRLFLLGVFCRQLDHAPHSEVEQDLPSPSVAAFLADLEASEQSGLLRAEMNKLPMDCAAQLDIVLRLAGLMLHKSNVRPRFVECVQAFTSGIGNGPGATLASLTAQYTQAHDDSYAPFMDRRPHILENFLINTIVRCQFPFGKEGMRAAGQPNRAQPNKSREFDLLVAQFTLIRGLLIGVAGHHRAAFSEAHVVHTVQAASKHFEHHPEFLSMAHALLAESGMDGARGSAILLRNPQLNPAAASQAARAAMPAYAAISSQGLPVGRPAWPPVPASGACRD
jgi:lysine-N-methylase